MKDSSSSSSASGGNAGKARLTRLSADVREDLVAYLDRECDEEKSKEIDHLLASNEVARREVDRLSQVYDLLDHLPRPAASTDFSNETMKTVEALKPVQRDVPADFKRHVTPWIPLAKTVALSFVCTLGGLFAGQFAFADRSDELLADLDAIEQVEAYRAVGDVEFIDWISRDSVRKQFVEGSNGR